jgi:hypothetical protein
MKKDKILRTLLPLLHGSTDNCGSAYFQNDLVGLVIPPEIANLLKGDNTNNNIGTVTGDTSNTPFEPPMLSGEPQYFPENNTVKFTYNFTNPLNTEINITTLQAEVVCHDHGFPLGNVGIDPATLEPGQTIDITAFEFYPTKH